MYDGITYVYQLPIGVGGESGQIHTSFYYLKSEKPLAEEQLRTLKNGHNEWVVLALKPVDGVDISERLNSLGIHHDEWVIGKKCLGELVESGALPAEIVVPEESSFLFLTLKPIQNLLKI